MNTTTTKSHLLAAGIALLAVFSLFFVLGFFGNALPDALKTVDSKDLLKLDEVKPPAIVRAPDTLPDSLRLRVELTDSTIFVCVTLPPPPPKFCPKDTSIKDILLIGDSQVEFLRASVYNYCRTNNYNLVASVVWYGSTTIAWGGTDTLDKYIKKYNPDFVICALGLNEIVIKNVEPRRKYIQTMKQTFADNHVPYYWIGPAAWRKDDGICALMQEELDTLFYPSHLLTLDRASDKRHPSFAASKIWFDSTATAMNKYTPLSFPNRVTEYEKAKGPFVLIKVPAN
ncbi:MAG TPA: hypothetical protein VK826_07475 [Bacteroidia bacterium]|nr:hypothetical protein [Bacteroidia bacterium]